MKKTMTMTLRFDERMERRLLEAAKRQGLSRSELVRRSVEAALAEEERREEATIYDQLAPWLGRVGSGGRYPARDRRKHLARFLEEKRLARRDR